MTTSRFSVKHSIKPLKIHNIFRYFFPIIRRRLDCDQYVPTINVGWLKTVVKVPTRSGDITQSESSRRRQRLHSERNVSPVRENVEEAPLVAINMSLTSAVYIYIYTLSSSGTGSTSATRHPIKCTMIAKNVVRLDKSNAMRFKRTFVFRLDCSITLQW